MKLERGTSTYDGISIAWSIAEYLHDHPTKAKTLFATHYHELNEMTNKFSRIKNFNVSIKRKENEIIFMRTLKEGGVIIVLVFMLHVWQACQKMLQLMKRF